MRTIRITVGGAGDPGGPGRRRIGLWLLMALALPILITAGVGYGVYHAFFRVPEFRALLFEGGRGSCDARTSRLPRSMRSGVQQPYAWAVTPASRPTVRGSSIAV